RLACVSSRRRRDRDGRTSAGGPGRRVGRRPRGSASPKGALGLLRRRVPAGGPPEFHGAVARPHRPERRAGRAGERLPGRGPPAAGRAPGRGVPGPRPVPDRCGRTSAGTADRGGLLPARPA
ncbi:hypothetical protein RZS08_29780, partial [Arthrospira platensis SPKY1]|nr:hypothetical protein [Arthrospira platensis SPKY1]